MTTTHRQKSIFLLVFLAGIFLFNTLGLLFEWYLSVWWYDIPMHIAGGAWLAFGIMYAAKDRLRAFAFSSLREIVLLCVAVAAIGIGWELFEYSLDIGILRKYTVSAIPCGILVDSFGDLANDLIGGLIASFAAADYFGKARAAILPSFKK